MNQAILFELRDAGRLSAKSCLGRTVMAAFGEQWKTLRDLEGEIFERWHVADTQPTISARLREVQLRYPRELLKQSMTRKINGKTVWFYRIVAINDNINNKLEEVA
ncbi:hypothetical protein [Celerinatantimonas sp. MCCC 1A17872]|uniref:hypothetical protein n=1 Tax=Celerinatantimonas sp. MCCC 1A17872 TaxID=3177514 RepID=UPI0038C5EA36